MKTSGRVPAARAAVKVGAVQLYSWGSTVTHGYLASNSEIWRFSASVASCVAPGRSTPTEIVTGLWLSAVAVLAGVAALVGVVVAPDPVVGMGVVVAAVQALAAKMVNAAIVSALNLRLGLIVISSLNSLCRSR